MVKIFCIVFLCCVCRLSSAQYAHQDKSVYAKNGVTIMVVTYDTVQVGTLENYKYDSVGHIVFHSYTLTNQITFLHYDNKGNLVEEMKTESPENSAGSSRMANRESPIKCFVSSNIQTERGGWSTYP